MKTEKKPIVLIAIDREPAALHVIEEGIRVAESRGGAEIHLVHAIIPNQPTLADGYVRSEQQDDGETEAARLYMDKMMAFAKGAYTRGPVVGHLRRGVPADSVIGAANYIEADVLVVGTHDYRGMKRFFLGSVAEEVVRKAGCPVFVIRPKHYETKAPEIVPLCDDCAKVRVEKKDITAWCERHSTHHPHGHAYHAGSDGFSSGSQYSR